jgi:mycofactocin precursor peptide MftA
MTPPFHFGTRCHILTTILTSSMRVVEPLMTKGNVMEPKQLSDRDAGAAVAATSDTELVTETLVEEVSIDGMCGVY